MPHKSRPFLIAGNWKMNLNINEANVLAENIAYKLSAASLKNAEIYIAPTYLQLPAIIDTHKDTAIIIGAQDCSAEDNGAHTGDISAAMIKDIKADFVILGHSERRTDHNESDDLICSKAQKAIEAGLNTIICVGETLEQREAGIEKQIIQKQLEQSIPESADGENCVIAYEPVWAIGTGKTASADDVEDMHNFIEEFLASRLAKSEQLRIIYGGSVKPENASELFALGNVSGALIGGASLKVDSFWAIAQAAENLKN